MRLLFPEPRRLAQRLPRRDGRRLGLTRWLEALLCAVVLFSPGPVSAQVWSEDDRLTMRQRREAHAPRIENALHQARAIQKSNRELALDILQSIFDAPEDSYYVTPEGCSLKDAAEATVLADREELLKPYERRFDAAANGLLEKARSDGGLSGLREVARRYALTAAGRQALLELATSACDFGDAASALRSVQRLRRNSAELNSFEPRLSLIEIWAQREFGNEDAVAARLADLKQRFPDALVVDDRRIPWFRSDAEREPWLARVLPRRGEAESTTGLPAWRLAHGDLRRNGVAGEAPPFLDTAWKAALADRYDDIRMYDDPWNDEDIKLVNTVAADLESRFRRDGLHPLPVAAPLVANDLAILSGFGSVKAFSLKTGELAWSTRPVDETLSALLAGTDSFVQTPKAQLMQQFVGQRAYRDHVDAALSTDGKRVYHVGHSGLVGLQPFPGNLPVSSRGVSPLLPRNYNQLQAYDINGGRCLWSIGGPPRRLNAVFNQSEGELDLDGAFFCMAPIPWGNQLLCIIEQSRQLRIVALDAEKNPEKAEPLWSQALLNSDIDLVYSSDRRFAGVNVALDGSTLIATLGNGTMVGFDVADRRWLWLHTYADPQPVDYRRQLQINRMNRPVTADANLEVTVDIREWTDTRTMISGKHVLATPFDDSRLLCLNRDTGETLWTRPRDQALYLAGVYDGVVLLVGKSDVRGLNLSDGTALWTTPIPPPSGRGVRMNGRYVLPLSTGEVLTLDVQTGAPLARSPLATGLPAGNLIAAGGALITQTASEVRAFRSASDLELEVQERLARNPDDAAALALRGELRLHRGDIADGERDLKASTEPTPRIQQVLAWATVNGLERDFAKYYSPQLSLEGLPLDPALRGQAWSAISKGLETQNDLPGALYAAVRAGENINPNADRLLDRENSLQIRENRLVRGRIDDLWAKMADDQRSDTIQRIRTHLDQLKLSAPELFRVYEMLSGGILPADLELAHLERRTLPIVATEQRLVQLRESTDPVIAARASLQLLRIAALDPRMVPSPVILADLEGPLKDVQVGDGRTAEELASELLNQPDVVKRREASRGLRGELVVTGLDDTSGIPDLGTAMVEYGPRSPVLDGWTFSCDSGRGAVIASDARGVSGFRETVLRGMNNLSARVSTCGRLVMIETPDGFRIFDAVSASSVRSVTLITEQLDNFMGGGFRFPRAPNNFRLSSTSSRQIAPLRREHLAYVKGPRLVVVDPLTGRDYWSRAVEGITDLCSDAEFVAAYKGKRGVVVFRAVDGRVVHEGELPVGNVVLEYRHDVQRLIHSEVEGGVEIGLYHPARNAFTWKKVFPPKTRFDVIDGRDVAALEPGGKLTILSAEGRELQTASLDPLADLEGLEVFQDGDRTYVSAARPSADIVSSIPSGKPQPISARITAIRRDNGERLWSRDFERLSQDFMQPGTWPFLLLVAAGQKDEADAEPRIDTTTWTYVVDRATGKTLHAAELGATALIPRGWKVDAATGAVSIKVGGVGLQVSPRMEPPIEAPMDKPDVKPTPIEPKSTDGTPPPPPEQKPIP